MTTKQIAQTAVGLKSLSLVARAGKMVKEQCPGSKLNSKGMGKGLGYGKGKGPIGKPKQMLKGFTDLTIGTALLNPMSEMANKL